jgi:predicted amidohydrolase
MPRIALAQIALQWGNATANLHRALQATKQACAQQADIVVLPECMDLGWLAPQAQTQAQPLTGERIQALQAAARAGIYIVTGLTERVDGQIYNSAVLINPDGDIALVHRKIHELPAGQALYARGRSLTATTTPWGLAGILICADNFMSSCALGEALGWMGVRWLFSPCAWAVSPADTRTQDEYLAFWLEPYRYLAQKYRMTIVAVSNVGEIRGGAWDGRHCIGSSVVVGPDGREIARAPYGKNQEALLLVDVSEEEPSR